MGLLNIFKKKSNIDLNTETISGSDSSNMDVSQITNLDGEKEKTKMSKHDKEQIMINIENETIIHKILERIL